MSADGNPPSAPITGPWTTREIEVLRATYPDSVDLAVATIGRSRNAVRAAAQHHGIKHKRVYILPALTRVAPDPFRDEAIRALFETAPNRRQILDRASSLGMSEGKIRRRATQLGLIIPRLASPAWCEAETELLAKHGHLTPQSIARKFCTAGFRRSPAAIAMRMHSAGISRTDLRKEMGLLSTPEIATGLGMTQMAVSRWCKLGLLESEVRDGKGDRPAGYDVKPGALLAFMARHPERYQLRKVNQDWFATVLSLAVAA